MREIIYNFNFRVKINFKRAHDLASRFRQVTAPILLLRSREVYTLIQDLMVVWTETISYPLISTKNTHSPLMPWTPLPIPLALPDLSLSNLASGRAHVSQQTTCSKMPSLPTCPFEAEGIPSDLLPSRLLADEPHALLSRVLGVPIHPEHLGKILCPEGQVQSQEDIFN